MGREVTLKGEFWQKKWGPRRIPCTVQGLCRTSRHGSADNAGGGQSVLNNYPGFLFPGEGVSGGWGSIMGPISVENLIKMSPNLEPAIPCGWRALATQSNSLKVKLVALRSQTEQVHALKTPQGLHQGAGGLNLAAENLENLEVQLRSGCSPKWCVIYHNFHHKPQV